MTKVAPAFKKPTKPTISMVLDALKAEIYREFNCVKIGTIQSFNAALQEATVQIAWTQVVSTAPDGTRTLQQFPLLLNVPVLFPAGGGFTMTFPVAEGDECVLLFNDAQIDNWVTQGAGQPTTSPRTHDLSDAVAIVGLRNNTRALGGLSTDSAQLRSDDGETYIEVAGGGIVNIVAPTAVTMTTPLLTVTGIINIENVDSNTNPCTVNGDIHTNGDVIASTISLKHHVHSGVTTGSGSTGAPVP